MHLLEMNHIRKTFPGVLALDDVSITLDRGQVLALLGENGAGKSTLIKVLAGVHTADRGSVIIDGKEQNIQTPKDALDAGIAVIYQELCLANDMTVAENIFMGREPKKKNGFVDVSKMNKKTEDRIVGEQVDAMRIKISSPQQLAINLSGGNQQKVVLGKWLAKKPQIIILDEPTRGIDVGSKSEIYEIMNRLTAEGCSIIMVSSELPEILGMSDRVCVMMEGKITAVLNREELTQEKIMHYSIGGAM